MLMYIARNISYYLNIGKVDHTFVHRFKCEVFYICYEIMERERERVNNVRSVFR